MDGDTHKPAPRPGTPGIRVRVKRLIKWLNAVRDQLFHVRFPLLTLAAGSAMVLAVPQVRELFYLLASNNRHWWLAFAATALLALAVWYCGRTIYRFRFSRWPSSHPKILPGFKRQAPRVMGAMVPVLMAIGCFLASLDVLDDSYLAAQLWLAGAFFVGEALLVWLLVVYRRPVMNRLDTWTGWWPDVLVPSAWEKETLDVSKPQEYGQWVRLIFLGGLVINLGLSLLAIRFAHELAWFLGPIATIMLAGAFFAISGSLITFAGTLSRIPLLSLILLFAVVLHAVHVNDNHYVRQCPQMNSFGDPADCPAPGQDPSPETTESPLERYWADWYGGLAEADPIFLVSAEGGGIRAAAWTALVLSHLSDQTNGAFDRHLFAGSGVSGGSLGIVTYVSLIKARRARDAGQLTGWACKNDSSMVCAANAILGRDFLGPNLVNLFFVDTLQRLLPARLMVDRGQRLEESWARSWDDAFAEAATDNPFEEPFEALYPQRGQTRLPLALLNATVVQSGDRFIQSPFRLLNAQEFRGTFPGARDSHDFLPQSLPLNAATHNSARFTYVSPAGTVAYESGDGERRFMQLVDGGYFENSGTVTLGDVYRWLKRKELTNPIYVIHISNDATVPSILPSGLDACPAAGQSQCPVIEDNALSKNLAGEASAPIVALLATRDARGENARQQLAQAVLGDSEVLMHFRLCRGQNQLPLGWALSDRAWEEMQRQLGLLDDASACFVTQHQAQVAAVRASFSAGRP